MKGGAKAEGEEPRVERRYHLFEWFLTKRFGFSFRFWFRFWFQVSVSVVVSGLGFGSGVRIWVFGLVITAPRASVSFCSLDRSRANRSLLGSLATRMPVRAAGSSPITWGERLVY